MNQFKNINKIFIRLSSKATYNVKHNTYAPERDVKLCRVVYLTDSLTDVAYETIPVSDCHQPYT